MEHELKILPQYFKPVVEGIKTFEIRENDRNYKTGDILVLNEYDIDRVSEFRVFSGNMDAYTGKQIKKEITYIHEGEDYELKKGWCVLGLKNIEVISDKEKQEFQLGDTAYCIDEDYRFFESEVHRIDLNKGEYFYTSGDADFEFKDIGDWVFTSELYREIHQENMFGGREEEK